MEASALHVPVGLTRGRTALGSSLLRLRSDEQLVAQFREGNDEAFSVIHDRYRPRLFAYTRQMFPGCRQDAEDAVQDVFVRAYSGLRANDRELALRAWLYRVAHNRCVDELRRPPVAAPELLERVTTTVRDPIDEAEQRDSLRRLIADVRRLPEQQRSALLMRELGGMSYEDLGRTLGVSLPAVKSLLVRARISLAQSAQSRDTPCGEIREELSLAHDRGVRPSATARRHLRDCTSCADFRKSVRGTSRQLAALIPFGPMGMLANMLGIGGGSGAAATGGLGGGAAAAGGATFISAGHIVTLLAAAAVTTGGALEIQHAIAASAPPITRPTLRTPLPSSGVQATGVLPAAVTKPLPPGGASSASSSPRRAPHATAPTSFSPGPAVGYSPPSPTAPRSPLTPVPPPASNPTPTHAESPLTPTTANAIPVTSTNGSTPTTSGASSSTTPPTAKAPWSSSNAGNSSPSSTTQAAPTAVPGASASPPGAGSADVSSTGASPPAAGTSTPVSNTTPRTAP